MGISLAKLTLQRYGSKLIPFRCLVEVVANLVEIVTRLSCINHLILANSAYWKWFHE